MPGGLGSKSVGAIGGSVERHAVVTRNQMGGRCLHSNCLNEGIFTTLWPTRRCLPLSESWKNPFWVKLLLFDMPQRAPCRRWPRTQGDCLGRGKPLEICDSLEQTLLCPLGVQATLMFAKLRMQTSLKGQIPNLESRGHLQPGGSRGHLNGSVT